MVKYLRVIGFSAMLVGVAAQFLQRTDPIFPLWYFTVDSAALSAAVMTWHMIVEPSGGRLSNRIRGAATVGVTLSALVYALVIAPNSSSGTWFSTRDDIWIRVATVLLHGVAPPIVIAEFLFAPGKSPKILLEAVTFLLWPLIYLVSMAILVELNLVTMPYAFLRSSQIGPGGVAVAIFGLAAIALAIGVILLASRRLRHRRY